MSYELKQSDIFDLANFIGAETKEKGDELFFKWCPKCRGGDHRDKETFSVNLKTGAFKCFRSSCDYHGHFVELARDVGFELDHGQKREYRQLPQRKLKVRDAALDYLASRGISAETGVDGRFRRCYSIVRRIFWDVRRCVRVTGRESDRGARRSIRVGCCGKYRTWPPVRRKRGGRGGLRNGGILFCAGGEK